MKVILLNNFLGKILTSEGIAAYSFWDISQHNVQYLPPIKKQLLNSMHGCVLNKVPLVDISKS